MQPLAVCHGGEGNGQLRVHHGEFGGGRCRCCSPLHAALVLGNHAAVAHLAARGGDGEHYAHRQAGPGLTGPVVELPHVGVLGQAVGDGLGGVDDAAAAHSQDKVYALFFAQLDALIHQRQPGVGHHAAQLHIRNSLALQRSPDLRKQARTLGAAAAVMDQNPATARFLHKPAGLLPGSLSENYFRWCMISNWNINFTFFPFMIDSGASPGRDSRKQLHCRECLSSGCGLFPPHSRNPSGCNPA